MRLKVLAVLGVLLMVAACSSSPEDTSATQGAGGAGQGTQARPGAAGSTGVGASAVGAPRPGSQEDLAQNVGDRVWFDFDKYDLSAEARAILQKQAAWLKTNATVRVMIEGHCDERGTREYNLALGERRANATRDFLVALGIDPRRMQTISYGKERPDDTGQGESSLARNRRAVTLVM